VRTGSPLTRQRRRGGAAEALDDENEADLFDTWADAPNDAALASVAKLWTVVIKYTCGAARGFDDGARAHGQEGAGGRRRVGRGYHQAQRQLRVIQLHHQVYHLELLIVRHGMLARGDDERGAPEPYYEGALEEARLLRRQLEPRQEVRDQDEDERDEAGEA